MSENAEYEVVVLSDQRRFIKEVGYGYIAEIKPGTGGLQPMNKGCDLTEEDLLAATAQAHTGRRVRLFHPASFGVMHWATVDRYKAGSLTVVFDRPSAGGRTRYTVSPKDLLRALF